MKGYLKFQEGCYQLAPKVTTIGKEGCDLCLQSTGVDFQHAVIEYSEQEECFVLQDLNTAQGTYVNDCRVQNAAVRLAPGDCIRFGYGGHPYELQVENSSQLQYPPVHQRAAWTQPLTVITDPVPPQVIVHDGLPHLRTAPATSSAMSSAQQWGGMAPPPRPPSMRSRPLSAGSRRPPTSTAADMQQRSITGWVGGHHQTTASRVFTQQYAPQQPSVVQNTNDLMAYQEKEQKILRLSEECRRLSQFEADCGRKEEMIQQLRHEIADLQGRLRQLETSQMGVSVDAEVTNKLVQLENELQLKRTEVTSLKEQITVMKSSGSGSPLDSTSVSRQEYNERVLELNSLRTELERCKKDKNITAGLVTQMQRDMSSKDTTISRLTREIENLRKEISDKDVQIGSLQSKDEEATAANQEEEFVRTKDNKARDEELETKEKEMSTLKVKMRSTEKQMEDQAEVIASLKEELEKVRGAGSDEKETGKKLQKELDACKAKLKDIERVELQGQVDMKQLSDKSNRFRSRVFQVTYSTPGIKAPDKEIEDDALIEQLKQLIDERTDLKRQIQDSKENLHVANSTKREILENSKKLKQQLNEAVKRLSDKGCSGSRLRQELDFIAVVSAHESIGWVKDSFKDLVSTVHTWETDIEMALQNAGVNIKISDESPAVHINSLCQKWTEGSTEVTELRTRLDTADAQYKQDLETALTDLRQELDNMKLDEIEKHKLEADEKMNRAIDEIRELETEKRETALEEYRGRMSDLEVNIEQLKASILEKEAEQNQNKEDTRVAIEEMERYKAEVEEVRTRLTEVESQQVGDEDRIRSATEELSTKHMTETTGFQEQIRQHSVTICTMEERLNKVMKKNKDYQSEMTHLRETITELQKKLHQKPSPAPKPKVIVQRNPVPIAPPPELAVMENLIAQLRKELAQANGFIKEQEDVIVGLRRDLQGASARLSDMTGELSEAQKEELEREKERSRMQGGELGELRQNMAKLSTIVDKQADEITALNTEINKQKSIINKYKNILNEKESQLCELQALLEEEKGANKKNLLLLEEEGRITSEMTAVGAQCRGERHEQVIARQREALTELRARIKALEQARPPLPTQDQALQQVVLLKKELAELRACQAMNSHSSITFVNGSSSEGVGGTTLQEQVNKARGMEPQSRAEADIERSAHRETMEAMELSENTYLTLLRAVASTLEMDEISGLRSMAHIPKDERQRLFHERETATEMLTSRIKVLRERIQRKDELLQGYERDLAKLRQAEKLADTKHAQVESLTDDMRSRTEETQYLRETLARAKDRLEQEKRLNSAIKSKKTYHLEAENVNRNGTWTRHKCPPEDIMGKQKAKKKATVEKIKRKNYEIGTLKSELTERDQDLQETRRRVVTLESTMGLENKRDPFEPPSALTN